MPPSPRRVGATAIPNLLELDRFSGVNLAEWNRRSKDLDQLTDTLHFGTEPERLKYREELLTALQSRPAPPLSFKRWVRQLTYRYCLSPLSAAGSLTSYGGRFNVGRDVEKARNQWPALYIAETSETAYCEYYQLEKSTDSYVLSPQELNLEAIHTIHSTATVLLDGHIEKVFNIDDPKALEPVCRILSKIKMPRDVHPLMKRLHIKSNSISMINNVQKLQKAVLYQNWRTGPIQYGLPSRSQVFAELIKDAGYEAIQYSSTKTGRICLAVFPGNVANASTFVSLSDPCPEQVEHSRLDLDSADSLCGWEILRRDDRY